MRKSTERSPVPFWRIHRNWIVFTAFILAVLTLTLGAPTWATNEPGARNQTVPAPTPTSEPQPPTPTSRPKDDDDDGAQPPMPTPTPDQGTPQEPPAGSTLSGVVATEALNVRSGPGTSYPVIGRLINNERVEILYRDQTGAWWVICCVQPNQQQGWVNASLIRPDFDPAQASQLIPLAPDLPTALPPPTPTIAATTPVTETPGTGSDTLSATVNAERLNMRSGPGVDFDIVAKLERNNAVAVLARNGRGDWWYICCATDTTTRGWVSAPYLTPSFDQAAALQLIPLFTDTASSITATQSVTATTPATETVIASAVTPTSTALSAAMGLFPPFAMQGERAQIVITVTNTTPVTAANVIVRNELPPALTFVEAIAHGGVVEQETTDSGAPVISLQWKEIEPSSQVSATITIEIASDLADGAIVDNLAAVTAGNANDVTTGISIGMPPVAPPDFR